MTEIRRFEIVRPSLSINIETSDTREVGAGRCDATRNRSLQNNQSRSGRETPPGTFRTKWPVRTPTAENPHRKPSRNDRSRESRLRECHFMGIPEPENDQLTDTILCVEALSGFLGPISRIFCFNYGPKTNKITPQGHVAFLCAHGQLRLFFVQAHCYPQLTHPLKCL